MRWYWLSASTRTARIPREPGQVHRARGIVWSRVASTGEALAGQGGLVEHRRVVQEHRVDRDDLALKHEDDVAHADRRDADLFGHTVRTDDERARGNGREQVAQVFARAPVRVLLQTFSRGEHEPDDESRPHLGRQQRRHDRDGREDIDAELPPTRRRSDSMPDSAASVTAYAAAHARATSGSTAEPRRDDQDDARHGEEQLRRQNAALRRLGDGVRRTGERCCRCGHTGAATRAGAV